VRAHIRTRTTTHPNLHVSRPARVSYYVTRLPFLVCLLASAPLAFADAALDQMLKAVEDHYNRAKTLQILFTEEYTAEGRVRRPESGTLILRKPGRMRWDYTSPAGKLFISDGKTVYLYTPDAHRVERAPLKASDDMRAPLAFLLGKLDFAREFKGFQTKAAGADTLLTAFANSDKIRGRARADPPAGGLRRQSRRNCASGTRSRAS
jgi:outer membrane lipoprotein carrier protein